MSDHIDPLEAARRILDANRAACLGRSPMPRGFYRTDYRCSGSGIGGRATCETDCATGRFVMKRTGGLFETAKGYNGVAPWWQDPSGIVTLQSGGDKPELAVNEAFRIANLWWRSDRGGASIAAIGRKRLKDRDIEIVEVTPAGGKVFQAWFDVADALLVRLTEQQGFQRFTTDFDHYRTIDGIMVAHRILSDNGDGPGEILTLARRDLLPEGSAHAFAPPRTVPEDHAILGGLTASVVPIEVLNNHIYLGVSIDGSGPFRFILDSGGHNILSFRTARALGLPVRGALATHGAGEGVMISGSSRVSEIKIGDAVLRETLVYVVDLLPFDVEGVEVDGSLGFETFSRFILRIDYAAGMLTLADREQFDPRLAGEPIPFDFYGHLAQVRGRFEGRPCRFAIDTGSRTEVTLSTHFVRDSALRLEERRGVPAIDGWGIGGGMRAFVFRGAHLSLDGVALSDVVASVAADPDGTFADPACPGNIGSKLMKRFAPTFDYGKRTIYLERAAEPVFDTGSYDRAGLWINGTASGGLVIADVTTGGPAEAAGLRAGDRIEAIDGTTVDPSDLSRLRLRLRNDAPGTRVALTITYEHGSAVREITLRDQI